MKRVGIIVLFSLVSYVVFAQGKTLYDFKVRGIEGEEFDLSALKGKKVLIVNVASKCGLTPQYKELEALYKQYGGDKFVIIGFPANNFAAQEPGTNAEIKEFCTRNYGVTFPMMEKISVKGIISDNRSGNNGGGIHAGVSAPLILNNVSFSGNKTDQGMGGGLRADNATTCIRFTNG